MEDAEAEAVLIALGPQLEWDAFEPGYETAPGFMYEEARFYTDEGHQDYTMEFDPRYAQQTKIEVFYFDKNNQPDVKRTRPNRQPTMPQHWYNIIAEAKAACEIHAATGTFPPTVEPELLDVETGAC